jgi:hypothetical protein
VGAADGRSYSYDNYGNRLTRTVNGVPPSHTYNEASQRTTAGGVAAQHDASARARNWEG